MKTKYIFSELTPTTLWLIFFFYSLITGLFFSVFLIPNISTLHYENFPLIPDSYFFNNVAINLADGIKEHGWQYWELYPKGGAAGQSSFLAILYYFFGNQPLYAVPFNAFFHASSGVLIYLIVKEILVTDNFSKIAATLSASLFIIFPSAMIWVSQIHKESCLSTGLLLALLTFIRISSYKNGAHEIVGFLFTFSLSLLCIATMKPYMLQILALILFIIIVLQCIKFFPRTLLSLGLFLIFLFITIYLFSFIQRYNDSTWLSGETYIYKFNDSNWAPETSTNLKKIQNNFLWEQNDYIPEMLDRKIRAVATARASLVGTGLDNNANTMIDDNVIPASAIEVFKYIPRAIQIAVLAPFPCKWFNGSLVSFVSSMEMLICYLAFFGLIFFLIFRDLNYKIIMIFIYAFLPITILGISSPNIGTLYRVRYTFEMLIVMLGICGWIILISKLKSLKIKK